MTRRILVLNGSPDTNGNSVRLARMFARSAGAGADAEFAYLYDEGVEACRACLACARGLPCPLPDTPAMDAILRRADAADCVVIASPLHFSSLTAPLVAFISRLQPLWHRPPRARERWGVLLASGGSGYDNMFRPARSVAAAAFRVLGLRFAGMAGAAGTDKTPVDENKDVLNEIKLLAERVCSCSSGL